MKDKKDALTFIKDMIKHKQEWKQEIETEFVQKGKKVNVTLL